MKASPRAEKEIIEHWYTLVAENHFSSREFYDHIEDSIAAQKVPGLEISRTDLSEGGLLSDKREYLRMKRERITFDVCAAPVGVNYFFSYRFYFEPAAVKPWEIIAAVGALSLLLYLSSRYVGAFLGPFLLVAICCYFGWVMRNAIGLGLRDLDGTLLKIPVLNSIYERWFRKDTYYRQDMKIAYCSIVSSIVKQEVERITGAKGVRLLREFTYSPVLKDLYRAKETVVSPAPDAEPVSA